MGRHLNATDGSAQKQQKVPPYLVLARCGSLHNLALVGVQIALMRDLQAWQHHNCVWAALNHSQHSKAICTNTHVRRGLFMHTSPTSLAARMTETRRW